MKFNGLGIGLGNLSRLSDAESRAICAENPTGGKGEGGKATEGTGANAARELGQKWKVSPSRMIAGGETLTMAEIEGSGAITHMWMAPVPEMYKKLILRMYWDGEKEPSVEVPVADFFCQGWGVYSRVTSMPIVVNPAKALNSYFSMPFRKSAKITMENIGEEETNFYYQIDYTLTEIDEDEAYFHAQYRRTNPVPYGEDYTIVDGISGRGHYVGTYLAVGANNCGWWGEGEIKFFMDGDKEFPTICGTGTEDYFGGAWNWDEGGAYGVYSTPFMGMHQLIKPDGLYQSQTRFGMYRWHVPDPIRFKKDLRVTIQDLGWRSEGRYLPLQDDIHSVAYWYQTEPHASFPQFPDKNALEIV